MHHLLNAGAGKIGSLIACLLAESGDYQVYLADKQFTGQDVTRLCNRLPHLSVTGTKSGLLLEENYMKKVYPQYSN